MEVLEVRSEGQNSTSLLERIQEWQILATKAEDIHVRKKTGLDARKTGQDMIHRYCYTAVSSLLGADNRCNRTVIPDSLESRKPKDEPKSSICSEVLEEDLVRSLLHPSPFSFSNDCSRPIVSKLGGGGIPSRVANVTLLGGYESHL